MYVWSYVGVLAGVVVPVEGAAVEVMMVRCLFIGDCCLESAVRCCSGLGRLRRALGQP